MKHYQIFILTVLLVTAALPAFAQTNTHWFVYFFDGVNNEIMRVYDTGEMEIYSLGLAENETTNGLRAISPDGSLVAFCKTMLGGSEPSSYMLIVREIATEINQVEMSMGATIDGCRPSGFNADDSQLVLGLTARLNSDPNTGQIIVGDDPLWRLQIIDSQTGNVLNELNSQSPSAPSLDQFGRVQPVPLMADVITFTDDIIVFRGIPYVGMEVPGELPAWSWNVTTNTVEPVANRGRVNSDYLPQTGELVYPALDESLDAAQPGGPISQANVVNLQLSDGTVQTLYRNADEVITSVRFVNNGEAIGVSLLQGFDMDNPSDIFPMRHILINRSGNITELDDSYEQYTQLASVPNAAVISWSEWPADAAPSTHLSVVVDDTLQEIWQYSPDTSHGYSTLELVWSPELVVQGTLAPFTPVQPN